MEKENYIFAQVIFIAHQHINATEQLLWRCVETSNKIKGIHREKDTTQKLCYNLFLYIQIKI